MVTRSRLDEERGDFHLMSTTRCNNVSQSHSSLGVGILYDYELSATISATVTRILTRLLTEIGQKNDVINLVGQDFIVSNARMLPPL